MNGDTAMESHDLRKVGLKVTHPRMRILELLGQVGVVRERLDPTGLVFVRGEIWKARSESGPIEPGTPVRIGRIDDDLVLEVAPAEEPEPVPVT